MRRLCSSGKDERMTNEPICRTTGDESSPRPWAFLEQAAGALFSGRPLSAVLQVIVSATRGALCADQCVMSVLRDDGLQWAAAASQGEESVDMPDAAVASTFRRLRHLLLLRNPSSCTTPARHSSDFTTGQPTSPAAPWYSPRCASMSRWVC
jgi:hypothetical protein